MKDVQPSSNKEICPFGFFFPSPLFFGKSVKLISLNWTVFRVNIMICVYFNVQVFEFYYKFTLLQIIPFVMPFVHYFHAYMHFNAQGFP